MDDIESRLRQCALDNATDLWTGYEGPGDEGMRRRVIDTANQFLAWLQNPGETKTNDTPTPHPFQLGNAGREHLPEFRGWIDEHQRRNCGTIYSPDDEAPPCQLPAGHPGAHVSVEISGAQRWEWITEEQRTARRNFSNALNYGLCGEPVPGRTPEKNCTRMAGHDGFHSAPGVDAWT